MSSPAESFTTVRSEGGLLPPGILARIAAGDPTLAGTGTGSYHLGPGERFGEAINRSWLRLTGAWRSFADAIAVHPEGDPATGLTRDRWLLPLFSELGYGRLVPARGGVDADGVPFPVSHTWGAAPIHLVGAGVDLDRRTAGVAGAARSSPHSLVQELLNRDSARLWGFVSNGLRLRVLRDNLSLTRQAFLEFDLEAMMDGEAYSDFVVLWLVCHQSRVEADPPVDCWLERWSTEARTQGTRALDHLRDGVEAAIVALGTGFLAHQDNSRLRAELTSGEVRAIDFYRQLLRVVYRLLFLLVAEERDLLLLSDAAELARARYVEFYSLRRLRNLAERRRGSAHGDLWAQVNVVVSFLGSKSGCPELGLPALGSLLFSDTATPALNDAEIANTALLEALRALSGRADARAGYRQLFDYRNLGVEELGSVYESLLELHPELNVPARAFNLTHGGAERRSTGSYYTPPTILKRVLDFALDPAIARALAASDQEAALLDLRILDPACGSGHFLIASAHRIARALASVRTGEVEASPVEVRRALREVVVRCVYGVDLNPMAVELCRVALWLETLEPGKPLSFLDHHIRVGNSVLGVPLGSTVARNRAAVDAARKVLESQIAETEEALRSGQAYRAQGGDVARELRRLRRQLDDTVYDSWVDAVPDIAFKPTSGDVRPLARRAAAANHRSRHSNQLLLAPVEVNLPTDLLVVFEQLGDGAENSVAEVTIRAEAFEGAQRRDDYRHLVNLADTWTSTFFWPLSAGEPEPPTQGWFATLKTNPNALPSDTAKLVDEVSRDRSFFHFELAWPEVFTTERGGFDVVVGNPPYLGGNDITSRYGEKVAQFLRNTAAEAAGHTDLAAYFVRRAFDALKPGGDFGLITTENITAADSRAACLQPIAGGWGGTIVDTTTSIPWEGQANVMVSVIHAHRGSWAGPRTWNGETVEAITPSLTAGQALPEPQKLASNANIAFQGSNVLGPGFVLSADQARRLTAHDERNAEICKPMIGADEVTARPDFGTDRWVIDFGSRSLEEAEKYSDCFDIVKRLVKPQRDRDNRASRRNRWWLFGERAPKLYAAIEGLDRVIVLPLVSKTVLPVFLPPGLVYNHKLAVFAYDDYGHFGILSSNLHWLWAVRWSSPRGADRLTYSTSNAFETLPMPVPTASVAEVAAGLEQRRSEIMNARGKGLTDIYNRVNDPETLDADIEGIRELHRQLDTTVAAAYGWDSLDLTYEFRPTRIGVRYTLSAALEEEVVGRLAALNAERASIQPRH